MSLQLYFLVSTSTTKKLVRYPTKPLGLGLGQ